MMKRAAALVLLLVPACGASADAFRLETDLLRLEGRDDPWGWRLLERSSGKVLLAHARTAFEIDGADRAAVKTAGAKRKGRGLVRPLALEGIDRPARAEMAFTEPGVLTVTLSSEGAGEVAEAFADAGEHVFGLWEGTGRGGLDNRGEDRLMLGSPGVRGSRWCNARAPFYVTDRGYGVWVETLELGRYAIGRDGRTGFRFRGPRLRYHVLYGPTCAGVLERYNRLAGPPRMPPLWAFGNVLWRNETRQDELERDLADLRRLRVPASVIWIDRPYTTGSRGWGNPEWNPHRFPEPREMIRTIQAHGMRLLLWVTNRCSNALEAEGRARGYLFEDRGWPAADLRDPDAYRWMRKALSVWPESGVRGYKIDRGAEGEMPPEVQNRNVVRFAKLAAEAMQQVHGDDWFTFARNVYGPGRQYAAVWNGDTAGGFGGLGPSLQHALRCAAINMPMWGSDTGGYHGGRADDEAKARWLAFSAYASMCEVMLDNFDIRQDADAPLMRIMRKHLAEHHRLIPYVRSLLHASTRTGMAPMRPMAFEFPADSRLTLLWDQYMLGPWLLVAPVVEKGATRREVLLPEGGWLDASDGRTVRPGGTTVTADAPLDVIPVFIREGAIIPRGDILKANNNWTDPWRPHLDVEVYPAAGRETAFDCFAGGAVKRITCTPGRNGVTIGVPDLGMPGLLRVHLAAVEGVRRGGRAVPPGPSWRFDRQGRVLTVPLDGAAEIDILGAVSLFGP